MKFSVVGMAGVAVQLSGVWFFARGLGIPAIVSTAMAVEVALLHNFAWHEAWTWPCLPVEGRLRRLLRFHAANGFVSLVSNAVFTWLFTECLGMPLLVSNLGAIGVTALLNFFLANQWVFRYEEVA